MAAATVFILDKTNYADFEQKVFNNASKRCKRYYKNGLAHLVQTNLQFAAETMDATTGVSILKPVNDRPDDIASNAKGSVRTEHTDKMNQYEKIEDTSAEVHEFILSLLCPADILAISDPVTSTRKLTCLNIMELMNAKYNTLDAEVLKSLKDKLKEPIASSETVDELVSRHIVIYAKLAAAGTEFTSSVYEKFTNLVDALSMRPEFCDVIKSYKITTPAPLNQTFEALVIYFREQAPNIQRSAAAVGYSASAQANSATSVKISSLEAEITRLGKELAAANRKISQGNTGGGKMPTQADCYCWVHGTIKFYSHDGVGGPACNAMKGANAAKYTDAQRGAKSANDIPGSIGCTKIYGK